VAVQLGVDAKKSDQVVRGAVVLPNGTGKTKRVAVFAQGAKAEEVGTVTPDVATAVRNAKAGQVQFRVDKAGIVHSTIGRRSFDAAQLKGNLAALMEALTKAKPASSKGLYLRKVAVSSTMGVGVRVDIQSITA
jgi:large subunit ribosomal protein L1